MGAKKFHDENVTFSTCLSNVFLIQNLSFRRAFLPHCGFSLETVPPAVRSFAAPMTSVGARSRPRCAPARGNDGCIKRRHVSLNFISRSKFFLTKTTVLTEENAPARRRSSRLRWRHGARRCAVPIGRSSVRSQRTPVAVVLRKSSLRQ